MDIDQEEFVNEQSYLRNGPFHYQNDLKQLKETSQGKYQKQYLIQEKSSEQTRDRLNFDNLLGTSKADIFFFTNSTKMIRGI